MAIYIDEERLEPWVIKQETQALRERYASLAKEMDVEDLEEKIKADARANSIERHLLMKQARECILPSTMTKINERLNRVKREAGGTEALYKMYNLNPDGMKSFRESIREQLRYEQFLDMLSKDVPAPEEERCREFYDKNPGQFVEEEQIHAAHIVRQPKEGEPPEQVYTNLLNLREQLAEGGDFAAAARAHSDCPENDGDLGWVGRGRMVSAFEEGAFALQRGEVSDVFQTEFGWHIVTIYDRRDPKPWTYEEACSSIRDYLWVQDKNQND